jgi:hypothetical protein
MAADHPVPEDFIPALQRAADDLKRFIREKNTSSICRSPTP